ncbi:MAG: hypothetical protein RIQ94_3398 [Pseudomonadota bacterium]|jgi:hypothetical protein
MQNLKSNRVNYKFIASFSFFLSLFIVISILIRTNFFDAETLKPTDQVISVSTATTDSSKNSIKIGVYIKNIYMLSTHDKTFNAEGFIWLTWPQKAEDFFLAQKLTPNKWLNFANQIDNGNFKFEQFYENSIKLKDGQYYQLFKFSGQFYISDIPFHKYPFETLKIPLIFELNNLSKIDAGNQTHDFHLVPDQASSGVGNNIDLIGYKTTAFNVLSKLHVYGSNFGSEVPNTKPISTDQAVFQTTYKNSINSAIITLFLPLTITMALVLTSPILSSSAWEIRLSIPPTALLTLVFLQINYRENLPVISYITFMDLIYNFCYLIIFMLFGLFLWGSNKVNLASEAEKTLVIEKIDLIDKRILLVTLLIAPVWILMNWISISHNHP